MKDILQMRGRPGPLLAFFVSMCLPLALSPHTRRKWGALSQTVFYLQDWQSPRFRHRCSTEMRPCLSWSERVIFMLYTRPAGCLTYSIISICWANLMAVELCKFPQLYWEWFWRFVPKKVSRKVTFRTFLGSVVSCKLSDFRLIPKGLFKRLFSEWPRPIEQGRSVGNF